MASDFIQLPADSTGKKLSADTWTQGANTVYGQNVVLYDAAGNPLLTNGRIPVVSDVSPSSEQTGTITTNGGTVTLALPNDVLGAHFDFSGTFTGSSVVGFEVSYDGGTTYKTAKTNLNVSDNPNAGNTLTAGLYSLGLTTVESDVGGATHIRAKTTAFQAGDSIGVRIRSSKNSTLIRPLQNFPVAGALAVGGSATHNPVYVAGNDGGGIVRALQMSVKGAAPGGTPYATYVHQPKDVGRNNRTFYRRPIITTNAEVMASLTQYYSGAAVAATATPAVVPAGKTLRIESIALSYMSTTTAGGAVVTMRVNTSGTAVIGSPQFTEWFIGGTNTAGVTNTLDIDIPDGLEFAAGTGIAFGVQGFTAAMAASATGYVGIHVHAYEY